MELEPCTWRQVVEALKRCGVQVASEDDYHVYLARLPTIKSVSKRGRVPVSVQKDLLVSFGVLSVEYRSYIPDEIPAN